MDRASGIPLAFLLGLAACMASPREETGAEVTRLDAAIASLKPRLEACRQEAGYIPLDDGEARLAPGEVAYRACLYAGIEEIVLPAIPHEEVRGWYRALVDDDRMLTDAVSGGRMTRGERQIRLDALWRATGERYRAYAERQVADDRLTRLEAERKRFEPNRTVMEIQDRLSVIHGMILPR